MKKNIGLVLTIINYIYLISVTLMIIYNDYLWDIILWKIFIFYLITLIIMVLNLFLIKKPLNRLEKRFFFLNKIYIPVTVWIIIIWLILGW